MLGMLLGVILQMVDPCSGVAFFALSDKVCEFVGVARGFPDERVHKDTAIDAYDVVAHLDGAFPPGFSYVVFQFNAERPVVVTACEAAVDFAGLKYETPSFAQRNDIFEFGQFGHKKFLK
jgi:hypothetical protein